MTPPSRNRHARRAEAAQRRRRATGVVAGAATGVLLPAVAQALPYDEVIEGELPDTFAGRELMIVGTDVIRGSLTGGDNDYFTLRRLAPGATFELDFDFDSLFAAGTLRSLSEAGAQLDSVIAFQGSPALLSGVVPASGNVNLQVCCNSGPDAEWSILLTLIAGDPHYDELVSGDLGGGFEDRTLLGDGASSASGLTDLFPEDDSFGFSGFGTGEVFLLTLDQPDVGSVFYDWVDGAGSVLDGAFVDAVDPQPGLLVLTAPPSGDLNVRVEAGEGDGQTWSVFLSPIDGLQVFDEDQDGDLGDSFAAKTPLGTASEVVGRVTPGDTDVFTLGDLPPGKPFELTLAEPFGGIVDYRWLDDNGMPLASSIGFDGEGPPPPIVGSVPANGEVHVGLGVEGNATWGVVITVPEPSGVLPWAAGLAGLTGLARLRRRD